MIFVQMSVIIKPMENYLIGHVLKEYRTRLNISQEEISFDLCAVSTLSRIEGGTQIPRRKLVEALFSKMGMTPPSSGIPMNGADFKRENLEYKINGMVASANFEIFDLLKEYKNCSDEMDIFEKQFYIFYEALAENFKNHDDKNTLDKYVEAIRFTVKNYELDKLPVARLLTRIELIILNNISRILYSLGENGKAISLMEFLRNYFETGIVSEEEKANNYDVILFNLESWYGLASEDEKTLELCEIAIDSCCKYGLDNLFPFHIFNKGCALIKLGKIEEGKKSLEHSFIIMEEMKKYDDIKQGKKWVEENLGLKI